MLSRPSLVVLDSSHISRLVTDWASDNYVNKRSAERFVPRLLELGWIPLLSWHQVAELLQHGNERLVDMRVRYLRSWPMVAWVSGEEPNVIPGSVLNIFSAEVRAAFAQPDLDALGVRDAARNTLLAYGKGIDVAPLGLSDWRHLRPLIDEQQKHSQKVAAISPWRALEIDSTRLADWFDKPLQSAESIGTRLSEVRRRLEEEIRTRGDKRIESSAVMADEFMSDVAANVEEALTEDATIPLPLRILLKAGLEPDDIQPQTTFREAMQEVIFRQRLKLAAEVEQLPWPKVKEVVTRDRIPSAIISEDLRRYGHDQPERKGSDVNDASLLCLAPYANKTFVDKRTLESIRRAKRKVPLLQEILGDVRKAANYRDITTALTSS
jgi:hypothetical protein